MNKLFLAIIFLASSCNTGNLKVLGDLPKTLNEISGTETTINSDLIWTLNDSGNKPKLYGITTNGKIKHELKIDAKNNDWEDLSTDNQGNLYIGDTGNNDNARKNLSILKVNATQLQSDKKINVERITFSYPDQFKFPPKKSKRFFDCEAFFWHNNYLYLFTKSRSHKKYGKTTLYKIPATAGHHQAQFLGEFYTCDDLHCWITSADISPDGKKVVLLNHKSAWVFTDFKDDNFLNGKATELPFNHISQKESICFKDNNTLYITDEKAHGDGGKLYEFKLKQ